MRSRADHIRAGFALSSVAILISTAIYYALVACNVIKTTIPNLLVLLSVCMLYGTFSNACITLAVLQSETKHTDDSPSAWV